MTEQKPLISIVIPAYNEEKNYKNGRLNDLFSFMKKQKFSWEVIFVNDGSTDQTLSFLKKIAHTKRRVSVLNISHGGKVISVKSGILQAKGEYVLFSDFDQSTPISEITKVLDAFKEGADVVIARRKKIYGWPLPQRIRSRIFNLLVQLIILPGIPDTQCGFKAFRTSIAKKLFHTLQVTKASQKGRYMGAFDVELLFLARKMHFSIKSIDAEWYCVRAGSLAASEPLKMLLNILTMRFYDLTGKYT